MSEAEYMYDDDLGDIAEIEMAEAEVEKHLRSRTALAVMKPRQRIEVTQSVHEKGYDEIRNDPRCDSLTPKGRRFFCNQRDKLHKKKASLFLIEKEEAEKTMSSSQVFVQCKNCKGGFVARKADRKRGWAKYCSKSCKAQSQY